MIAWIEALRRECEKTSQSQVALRLRQPDGFPSRTVINKVLKSDYNGGAHSQRLQSLVEAHFIKPDGWIDVLRTECERTSQSKVAATLKQRVDGFPSPTVINQVLNDKYPSDKGRARLQDLVRGRYMGVTVVCPVEDVIGLDKCAELQRLPFSTCNPIRVQLYCECRRCPNRREEL